MQIGPFGLPDRDQTGGTLEVLLNRSGVVRPVESAIVRPGQFLDAIEKYGELATELITWVTRHSR